MAYRPLLRLAGTCARAVVRRVQPEEVPFTDAVRITILPFWGAILFTAYLLVAWATGLPAGSIFGSRFEWTAFPRGFVLGAAEVSLSMLIATVIFRVLAPLRRAQRGGNPFLEYQTLGESGWMRSYRNAFERLPSPVAYLVVAIPLFGEEVIFRATAIPLLLPLGLVPAVVISTVFFSAVQAYGLPSWYQALGPISGAVVMGVGHGLLFAKEGNLLPLLVAHVTFLVFLMGAKPAREDGRGAGQPRMGRRSWRLLEDAHDAKPAP
jgi:hypothetical protein